MQPWAPVDECRAMVVVQTPCLLDRLYSLTALKNSPDATSHTAHGNITTERAVLLTDRAVSNLVHDASNLVHLIAKL